MIRKISEGDVVFQEQGKVNCGPRTALLPDGSVICTYMSQTAISSSDFVPMAAYSKDGEHWSESKPIWPELVGKKSPFVSVRNTPDGGVSLAGMWFEYGGPDKFFWSDETGGMEENQLVWSISQDGGKSFPLPREVALPYCASAEQPGGMLVRKNGEYMMVYAPYPTTDPNQEVVTNQIVLLRSTDRGETFQAEYVGKVDYPATYAETWICELTDGRLVMGSWMVENKEHPDLYFLSKDGGKTFSGPLPMGFQGQSTSITAYTGNRIWVPYNQRQHGRVGVWLALAKPDDDGFHLLENQIVWEAQISTRSDTAGDFSQWTDYSFGEPHCTVLPDGTLLVVLWYEQPNGKGIRYVHLAYEED